MNWKKPRGSRTVNDQGFSLIEVLVSISIVTMIMLALWGSFTTGIRLVSNIPETGETNIQILQLEKALRREIGNIRFPIWVPEFEVYDDESIQLPYYQGYEFYLLNIYSQQEDYDEGLYLMIQVTLDRENHGEIIDQLEEQEEVDFLEYELAFGPFAELEYEHIFNDDDNIEGVEITVVPLQPNYGEVTIYEKTGGTAFWKEK